MLETQVSQPQQAHQGTSVHQIQDYGVIGLKAGLVAALLNTLFFFVAQGVQGGLWVQAGDQAEAITLAAILAFSFLPSVFAAMLFWSLDRFTGFPKTIFLSIAVMVFAGFLVGPIVSATTLLTIWMLELMHLTAALPIVLSLVRVRSSAHKD